VSAFAADRQFGRPAVLPLDRQPIDQRPTVRVNAQSFAMPGNTVGSALAPDGTSFPMPQEVALLCTTCNIRNEVSSHVSQLSIDAFHGDNEPGNFPIRRRNLAPAVAGQLWRGARAEMRDAYGWGWTDSRKIRGFA
jgi:hypothetical protein